MLGYGQNWCDGIGVNALFPMHEWHHVTVVVNNSKGKVSSYLDGSLSSEKAIPKYQTNNRYPLIIGRHFTESDGGGGYEYNFQGTVDDLRIYNRSLSLNEIARLAGVAP